MESNEIPTKPLARDVFPVEAMQGLFAHPSATLLPLNNQERAAIADLPLLPRITANGWIGIEDEIVSAERSEIDRRIARDIEIDLKATAMEGMTAERGAKVRLRAAWLAHKFVFICDKRSFDPAVMINGSPVRPRSLLDVHHMHPLEGGPSRHDGCRFRPVMPYMPPL